YVPGGTAAYPSTVLMNAIPASIAGCPHIVITTPPGRDGRVNPWVLAAAHLSGVHTVYKAGGAQAIAALAYGTQTIQRVDKIVGPGNAYVAEAKRQVFGRVAIDMIAGPSEITIIADAGSNPEHLACDLLAQAEHDALASAVLLTPDAALAQAVADAVQRTLPKLSRQAIAAKSIDAHGMAVLTKDLDEAMDIANELAPEHLELSVEDPFAWLPRVKAAGSVFLGRYCPEALGDYYAGPNHTLPTNGTARFQSPLSVDDFTKKTQYTYYTREAFLQEADAVARFARTEGLTAHALSASIRKESQP
ncbi:MAG: histidinol dehydrogenase, partial [Clostridiales bacterium]|nr:histidinol dehydrogenase [Clostridiales bacterium]